MCGGAPPRPRGVGLASALLRRRAPLRPAPACAPALPPSPAARLSLRIVAPCLVRTCTSTPGIPATTTTCRSSRAGTATPTRWRSIRRPRPRDGPGRDHRPRQHRRRPRAAEPSAGRPRLHHGRGSVVLAAGAARRVEVHFGTWGMTETAHRDMQPLRGNAVEVAALSARRRHALRLQPSVPFLSRSASARRLPQLVTWRRQSRRATARCCRRTTVSRRARWRGFDRRARARPSAAATRTHCAASAAPGPRRRAARRRSSWQHRRRTLTGRWRPGRHAAARGRHLRRDRADLAEPRRTATSRDRLAAPCARRHVLAGHAPVRVRSADHRLAREAAEARWAARCERRTGRLTGRRSPAESDARSELGP